MRRSGFPPCGRWRATLESATIVQAPADRLCEYPRASALDNSRQFATQRSCTPVQLNTDKHNQHKALLPSV